MTLRKTAIRNVPKDWELVVREACPMSPFTVVPMDASKFLDFAELPKQYTHRKKDADKPVLISNPNGQAMRIWWFLSCFVLCCFRLTACFVHRLTWHTNMVVINLDSLVFCLKVTEKLFASFYFCSYTDLTCFALI